jgi:hypothetical protein
MCDHCHFPPPKTENRRSFLWKVAGAAAGASLLGVTRVAAQTPAPPIDATSWARLITPGPYWTYHSEAEPQLVNFIRRETKLKVSGHSTVRASLLEQLCASRFLFTNNLTAVRDPQELLNLREYLYRGGFIYIDTCVRGDITPSFGAYYRLHLSLFAHLAPDSEVRLLPSDHPIFRTFFPIQQGSIPSGEEAKTNPRWKGAVEALYGVFDDDRMIALLSLDHLFCGWTDNSQKESMALRQIANIYGYAMMH